MATASSVRVSPTDLRIDVRARFALQRMLNGKHRRSAVELLSAVDGGRIAGIFGDDLKAAAVLAKTHETHRWLLVPKGQWAMVIPDAARPGLEPHTIVFRETAGDVPGRLEDSLSGAWILAREMMGQPFQTVSTSLPEARMLPAPPRIVQFGNSVCWAAASASFLQANRVSLPGRRTQKEIIEFFAARDCLIHTPQGPDGLPSPNEPAVMGSGLGIRFMPRELAFIHVEINAGRYLLLDYEVVKTDTFFANHTVVIFGYGFGFVKGQTVRGRDFVSVWDPHPSRNGFRHDHISNFKSARIGNLDSTLLGTGDDCKRFCNMVDFCESPCDDQFFPGKCR